MLSCLRGRPAQLQHADDSEPRKLGCKQLARDSNLRRSDRKIDALPGDIVMKLSFHDTGNCTETLLPNLSSDSTLQWAAGRGLLLLASLVSTVTM